jgi:hypothetical protein
LTSISLRIHVSAESYAFEREQSRKAAQQLQTRIVGKPALPTPPTAGRTLEVVGPALRQPWLPVLRAVESRTRPPVYLLTLSFDPGSGLVRLEGEAPTYEGAIRYVQSLQAPGLLESIQLRSHEEAVDAITNAPVIRFSAQSRWVLR